MVQRINRLNMNIDTIQKIQNHMGDALSKKLFKLRLQYSMFEGEDEQTDIVRTSEGARQIINVVNQYINANFVLFGSGMGARWLINILGNIKWKCIIDNYPNKNKLKGISVIRYNEYKYQTDDIIIISSLDYHKDMKQQLLKDGIDEKYIINIADFSRLMYCNQYFDLQQLKPIDNEVFCDVGSYDGTTAVLFSNWNPSKNAKIYAFEPDKDNFAKCNDNLLKCKCHTKLIKAGCWSKTTQLRFSADGSCASKMDENGNMVVDVVNLDDTIKDDIVTFIKMDIEGAEQEALIGARKIISTYHPRMAISIYHRNDDIYEIPKMILEMDNTYTFYLRHYTFCDADTVLYAI